VKQYLILHPKVRLSSEERQLIMTGRRQNANTSRSSLKGYETSHHPTRGTQEKMMNRTAMTAKVQRDRAALILSMLFFISLVILSLVSPLSGRAAENGAMVGYQAGDPDRGKQLFENAVQGATRWIKTRRVRGYEMSMAGRQAAFPPSSIRTL
jgi:hypothetical protein